MVPAIMRLGCARVGRLGRRQTAPTPSAHTLVVLYVEAMAPAMQMQRVVAMKAGVGASVTKCSAQATGPDSLPAPVMVRVRTLSARALAAGPASRAPTRPATLLVKLEGMVAVCEVLVFVPPAPLAGTVNSRAAPG